MRTWAAPPIPAGRARPGVSRLLAPRRVALALDGAFLACVLFFVLAAVAFGQRGAETPWDNWWLAGPMVGAAAAALAGGLAAIVALARGDRHRILLLPLALGLGVLAWSVPGPAPRAAALAAAVALVLAAARYGRAGHG